jgi:hypothetical protein
METQILGWQDIKLKVPINWHMVFEKKQDKKQKKETGYFGFRDEKEKKLEISWVKFDKKAPEIGKTIKEYYKSLKKAHKKIKIRTEGEREVKKHSAKYIYWELDKEKIQGYVVTWNCSQTQRLIICTSQFLTKDSSVEKQLIMGIITQIDCHPESEFSLWSAPNLQIYSPYLGMTLKKREFLIGLTFLHLSNNDLDFLAYRIGLANQKISDVNEIPDWFKTYYKKHLPRIPSNYSPEEFTKLIYKKKTVTWKAEQVIEKKLTGKKSLETYLWSNTDKNDIYCLVYSSKGELSKKNRDSLDKMTKLAIEAN